MQHIVANFSGGVRREIRNGRHYLVAPATLIVPGVLDGNQGPLLYPIEEIRETVDDWEGIPITVGHPTWGGHPTSAREPGVLDRLGIGALQRPEVKGGKLIAEAWFDVVATRRVAPVIIDLLSMGQRIELSTGLFSDNERAEPGAPYDFIARNYRPDHLAILLGQKGACSVADGCGILNTKFIYHTERNQHEDEKMTENQDRSDFLPLPTANWADGRQELVSNIADNDILLSPLEASEQGTPQGLDEYTINMAKPLTPLADLIANSGDTRDRSGYLPPAKMQW